MRHYYLRRFLHTWIDEISSQRLVIFIVDVRMPGSPRARIVGVFAQINRRLNTSNVSLSVIQQNYGWILVGPVAIAAERLSSVRAMFVQKNETFFDRVTLCSRHLCKSIGAEWIHRPCDLR